MAGTLFDKTAIPFDGSNGAELAVTAIGPILEAAGGDLYFILVFDQYVKNEPAQFGEVGHLTIDQAAKMACERLVASAVSAGFNATFTIGSDTEVVDGVVNAAKAASCTAIVLPTHSVSGVTRWLMGNLRDKIVNQAGLPILALPPV